MSFENAKNALFNSIKSVFGTDATYTYISDGSTTEIRGVFDNAFVEINGIADKLPSFRIILSDLDDEPTLGDLIEINSITYRVECHEPDSHGSTTLILQRN